LVKGVYRGINGKAYTGKDRGSQGNSEKNNECSSGKLCHVPDAEPEKEAEKEICGVKQGHK